MEEIFNMELTETQKLMQEQCILLYEYNYKAVMRTKSNKELEKSLAHRKARIKEIDSDLKTLEDKDKIEKRKYEKKKILQDIEVIEDVLKQNKKEDK
jgi:hypothetical protein